MNVTATNGNAAANTIAAIAARRRRFEARTCAVATPITPASTAISARSSSAWRLGHGQSVLYAKNAATPPTNRHSAPTAIGRRPNVLVGPGGVGGGGGSVGPPRSVATAE